MQPIRGKGNCRGCPLPPSYAWSTRVKRATIIHKRLSSHSAEFMGNIIIWFAAEKHEWISNVIYFLGQLKKIIDGLPSCQSILFASEYSVSRGSWRSRVTIGISVPKLNWSSLCNRQNFAGGAKVPVSASKAIRGQISYKRVRINRIGFLITLFLHSYLNYCQLSTLVLQYFGSAHSFSQWKIPQQRTQLLLPYYGVHVLIRSLALISVMWLKNTCMNFLK